MSNDTTYKPAKRRDADFGKGENLDIRTEQERTFNGVKMSDADRKAFLALINNHEVPVEGDAMNLIVNRKKSGEIESFKPYETACFLRFSYGACNIDHVPSWLEYPKGDTRNSNLYLQGQDGLLRTLSHLWREVPMRDVNAVYTALRAQLLYDGKNAFKSDCCTFVTGDGTIFRVNQRAETLDDAVSIIDHVEPEDHVLAGSTMPVIYNPDITSHPLVDAMFDAWGDGNPARTARLIETHYSVPLVKFRGAKKGLILDIDYTGGTGKTVNAGIMQAFFGEGAIRHLTLEQLGNNRFARGQVAPAKIIYDDELTDHTLSAQAASTVKSLVTGSVLDGEIKNEQQLVDCFGQSVIVASNHKFRPSQSEAVLGAWVRRLFVVPWLHVFDTGDPETSKEDNKNLGIDIVDDDDAMSYILNLALDGLRRFVVNGGYTRVPEDDLMAREMLLGVDTVARFLEERDVYGSDWDMPRLVPFGTNGRKTALVFPFGMFDDAKPYYDRLKRQYRRDDPHVDTAHAFDFRCGDIVSTLPDRVDQVGIANDINILYGEYQAWHATQGTGLKGCVSFEKFRENLKRKGYDTYRARNTLLGSQRSRYLVPLDRTDAVGFRDFIAEAQASFVTSQHGDAGSQLHDTTTWRSFAKRTINASPVKSTNAKADDGNMYVSDEDLKNLSQDQLMELARVAVGLRFSGLLG